MKRFLGDNHYFFSSSAIYSFPLVLQSQIQFCWLCLSHTHHNLIHQERMQMTLSQRPSTLYQKKKRSQGKTLPSLYSVRYFAVPHEWSVFWSPSTDVPGFVSFPDSSLNYKLLALFEPQEGTLINDMEKIVFMREISQ